MRKQPKGNDPIIPDNPSRENIITQTRHYKLITPLFGGGVEPGKADPITTIRGTEIRGQLRFWWRAIRGWQADGSIAKLKEKEEEIWGGANVVKKEKEENGKKRQVQQTVQIEVINVDKRKQEILPYNHANLPRYAAFPLQLIKGNTISNLLFDLTISYHKEYHKDVEAALWAWETFGGIGGRTRRGFGAIQLVNAKIEPNKHPVITFNNKESLADWIEKKLQNYIKSENFPDFLPHLSNEMSFYITSARNSTPTQVWSEELIKGTFEAFRKNLKLSGNKEWPETEIRRTLKSKGTDHFASPLILRPLKYGDGPTYGIIAVLQGTLIPPDNQYTSTFPKNAQNYSHTQQRALTKYQAIYEDLLDF